LLRCLGIVVGIDIGIGDLLTEAVEGASAEI
jgi:hypothetical protein